jgi:hypothetical protein
VSFVSEIARVGLGSGLWPATFLSSRGTRVALMHFPAENVILERLPRPTKLGYGGDSSHIESAPTPETNLIADQTIRPKIAGEGPSRMPGS